MKPVNPRRFVTFLQDHVQVHPATVLHVPEGEGFRVIAEIPEKRDTYNKAFLQVGNIWTKNATVKEFCWGQRLARLAAELMGVRGVRMYHDQALYKEAGGGITPWHADQYYWPISNANSMAG